MFQPIVKKSELISDLTNLYGSKITTADVKGYCASHGYKYYTITRYLKDFKVTRGKWNLKVTAKKVAQIEKSFDNYLNKQRDKGIGGNTRPGADKVYYGK